MAKAESIYDVFKVQGQPTITYVRRNEGLYEDKLAAAIKNLGTLCLITGPSKTGKSTLYAKVAEFNDYDILRLRCDKSLTSQEVWRKTLETINFERVETIIKEKKTGRKLGVEIEGRIGWSWLAGILGKGKVESNVEKSEAESRNRILSDPSPSHLIPLLKELPFLLVFEDFHYLDPKVQECVFQQWKVFVDNEVSVVVLGTTHHAADLAYANKDLIGRIVHVDLPTWNVDDLEKITRQGFNYLDVEITSPLTRLIAKESVGLPIITQSVSLQMLIDKKQYNIESLDRKIRFNNEDVCNSLHEVAVEKYGQFSTLHDALIKGPRKRVRKYETYEVILAAFTKDPLVFSLSRDELDERIVKLLPEDRVPPRASVDSTLDALKNFQQRLGFTLLEWQEKLRKLYIIEPSFLFYLRWRQKRTAVPQWKDIFEILSKDLKELTKFSTITLKKNLP